MTTLEKAARADVWVVLDRYPQAAPVVLEAVKGGKIHGINSLIESIDDGMGACFYAHVAKAVGKRYAQIAPVLERSLDDFIWGVRPGDTPTTSVSLAAIRRWIVQWQRRHEKESAHG